MISAIVVNFNGASYLPRCLGSLSAIDSTKMEILLVDNASSDRSLEIVERRFPHIRVLALDQNQGFASANNLAAKHSKGDKLLLINPDAWIVDNAIDSLNAKLANHERIGLVAPRLSYPDGRPQYGWAPDRSIVGEMVQKIRNLIEHWPIAHGVIERRIEKVFGDGRLSAACWLVRKSAFDSIGGFDSRFFLYFEDVDFCIRLRRQGWRLERQPLAEAVHIAGGSPLSEATEIAYRQSQLLYYQKHRPKWEQRLLKLHLKYKYGRLRSQSQLCQEIYDIVDSFAKHQ